MKLTQFFKQQALLCVALLAFMLPSQSADLSLGVQGGSMGNGLALGYGISDSLKLRGGYNSFEGGADFDEGDLSYEASLELDNQFLMLDYHPFGWAFRFTVGFYNNGNAIRGSATASVNETIGSGADTITFTKEGTVTTDLVYQDSMATYAGIGFGTAAKSSGGLGFSLDIGVVSTGPLKVNVGLADSTRQTLIDAGTSNAEIDAAIAAETSDIDGNEEFEDFDAWLLFQLGINFSF